MTYSNKHPARNIDFTTLEAQLQNEVKNKNVYEVQKESLSLYCYTNRCVYHRLWNEWNILARGLILDRAQKQVIATPFPKFFNFGELSYDLPNEPFEAYTKMDGSLGIAYFYQDNWHLATKGEFNSTQAIWGSEQLHLLDLSFLEPGTTYLFELVYPENQIVIRYPFKGLILLAAYQNVGYELDYYQLASLATKLGIKVVEQIEANSISSVLEKASLLEQTSEGFVLRFINTGLRLKIKGSEYCRIHKLISGITPLGIWKYLKDGADLELIRQEISEEYWEDFEQIQELLSKQLKVLIAQIEDYHQHYSSFSDQELGLIFNSLPDLAKKFVFARRKEGRDWHQSVKIKEKLYALIRPINNELIGYSESRQLQQAKLDS
ncbi:2'-5' RNA ligase [Aphanothece hegewaldii CCALA 016]|uniref:2'-5' RNA ligase n=1 Tax=Aphanothece hegewaldii CCALA 016 TaxID=2107694 RepID=A0A2T1LR38_9CHRO|nr:T4 RnlA family RNA ligase [Aphanothece hegewaldii]PSF30530.1 2'-5' RNA ligase [Aphanothece hegewaldii CCALA 016]